ncbi:hypothetical protein [uncultured Sphaerochaeta sp.]|uniref:hypothetical protein n=1 Tax=uncultured Sphaerochaeta sp. TaxID=886478 RepID=UPI002A0A12D9|nr:hypothetical protein [uncultured Sphaerochaeta sp.]
MKKPIIYLLLALVLILGAGCDLFPFFNNGTIYFYEMAGENDDSSSYRLKHRDDGYTIIMSRGRGGFILEKEQAEDLIDNTVFSLTLDGAPLQPIGEMTVDELGNTGWHVVQNFSLQELSVGFYTLVGVTKFPGLEEGSRRNEVTLEIY